MSDTSLFDGFSPVSSIQWKAKIISELKNQPFDSLLWKSNEGITVKPFYTANDVNGVFETSETETFKIVETIVVLDAVDANTLAQKALRLGAEEIHFILSDKTDCSLLFKNLNCPLHITLNFTPNQFLIDNEDYLKNTTVMFDPIGELVKTGNWFIDKKTDFSNLRNIAAKENLKLSINIGNYQNSGANSIAQLAFGLAQLNEYFTRGFSQPFAFEVAIGGNYFFEIAKLKALRLLVSTLADEYKIPSNFSITAIPSKRNKTIYDYNGNLLRTTTEYMSAILGGADNVTPLPYDTLYHNPNDFSQRMGINQLLILKEEAGIANNKAVEGTYYISSITEQLAENALSLFKEIEGKGGFIACLQAGFIQESILKSAKKEQEQFNKNEKVLVGSNKYQNGMKMKTTVDFNPFLDVQSDAYEIEPIHLKRLAAQIELERWNNE